MANQNGGGGLGEAVGAALVLIIHVVFSLTFPLLAITLAGVSYLLAFAFQMPEFSLWAYLASLAFDYARGNVWVAIGLVLFALSALPLAWVAFREQELKASNTILSWVIAGMVIAFMFWLRTVWPFDRNGWQVIAYGIILFMAWSAVIEVVIGTLGVIVHVRRNRPIKTKPPVQEPHGAAQDARSRGEPETI